jgi:hypothetical protein
VKQSRPMRFAYADPPYLGMGAKLYKRPEWDRIETHAALIERLNTEYPDGWALSCSSTSLREILPLTPKDCRLCPWVKPFCSYKPNVNPAYAWEMAIWRGGRPHDRMDTTVRDWVSANITLRKGCPGAKPAEFALKIVELLNAQVMKGDTIVDLFHGSGAMLGVWRVDAAQIVAQESAA